METGKDKKSDGLTGLEIAVIGMAGRFPGAGDLDEFWDNLINGVESISFFTRQELAGSGVDPEELDHPDYVMAKGVLEDLEYFDASFFGYNPREAEIMTPQTRIFHECAWAALEDAGYEPDLYDGLIGVFAGAAQDIYWELLAFLSGKIHDFGKFESALLSSKDPLGTRIAYKFNLRGPSFTLYTACSTSGVAIHQACQALLGGECHMALAGGVSVWFPGKTGYLYQEGMIISPDGHCRVFEAGAKGSVFGDGVGVVILKPLDDALKDRDHVYAVIKGSALNNDGSRKVGYTAPSTEGQAAVMRAALHAAGVEVDSIGYIETHGTGTTLGDTIEVEAMKLAYNADKKGSIGIGSVKSNIGHLNTAAAISGFIKAVLSLKHRLMPPTLHYERPNPGIDFDHSPFFVVTKPIEWRNNGYPRRAGVSAFGLGGTNFHAILEESPGLAGSDRGRKWHLMVLSARTASALEKLTENLAKYLDKNPEINPGDVCFTLQVGRKTFKHRRMLVSSGAAAAVDALSSPGNISSVDGGKVYTAAAEKKKRPVVFMFAGVGAQYVNMGRDLYEEEPVFRQQMDRCFDILKSLLGRDVRKILYPENPDSGDQTIQQPEISQPLIFSIEYALARLVMGWGIFPQTMIGYSLGEYTAACVAGVFSLEDALKLVVTRADLIRQTPLGAMLSVPLPVKELRPMLDEADGVSIAIDNGAAAVVAGTAAAVDAFERKMKNRKYMCMRVDNTRALHSKEMEPILEAFRQQVSRLALKEPRIPYVSNVTGKRVNGNDVSQAEYWARHLRETVQFASGLEELSAEPNSIFVEIGPGRDLSALVRRYIENHSAEPDNPGQRVINLLRHPQQAVPDAAYLLGRIGRLWLWGVDIDWGGFYGNEKRRRISLPTYPFEGERYWIEGNPFSDRNEMSRPQTQIKKKSSLSDWFYLPLWKQVPSLPVEGDGMESETHSPWLVLLDSQGIGDRMAARLKARHQDVVMVKMGNGFAVERGGLYTVNPQNKAEYRTLIQEIQKSQKLPRQVVHLWSLSADRQESLTVGAVEKALDYGFYSLVYLVQAFLQENIAQPTQLTVVTNNMQAVSGERYLRPEMSPLLGALNVIPQENPSIRCRSVDIVLPEPGDCPEERLVDQLLTELKAPSPDPLIALRDNRRWRLDYEPVKLTPAVREKAVLEESGVYLITGGTGNIGLMLARYLAGSVGAKLALIGRSPFPPRDQWDGWLTTHQLMDKVSQRIGKIREIEELAGAVLVMAADVADEKQMREAVSRVGKTLGPINGVIHAAGVVDEEAFTTVGLLDKGKFEVHSRPKIAGLLVLQKIFEQQQLDFLFIMSSISSVLGGLGFSAYAAANIFMDSLLQQHNRQGALPWLAVNWDSWQVGENHKNPGALGASLSELSMNTEEGVEAFRRVLSRVKEGRVVHSLADLSLRIDQWIKRKSLESEEEPGKGAVAPRFSRADLSSAYAAPRCDVEHELVEIWQRFFGFDQLGIGDDFFEIGGDSLKAISLANKINRKMNVNVPITIFFEKLTIEGIAEYIKGANVSAYALIEQVEEKQYYATSVVQKKFFILNEIENIKETYNIFRIVTIEGQLDRRRLEEVFRQLIERQESLRTSFHLIDREIVIKVHDPADIDFCFEYADLQGSRPAETDGAIKSFSRPFVLSRPPLLRAKILRVEEERYLLLFDIHHIIADNESLRLLLKEIVALYGGDVLPALKRQYNDYACWQQKFMESEEYKKQESFWLEKFSDGVPLLEMPTDFPRPAVQSFEGEWLHFRLEDRLIQGIKELADDTGATLYMVLLAALNVLLSRYTGQQDIIVGSAIGGRDREELEHIIGVFMNVMPMRNLVPADESFVDFLNRVKQNALTVFENQNYPLGELVERLGVVKNLSRNPLNDVELIMVKNDFSMLETRGLRFISYEFDPGTAPVDITIEVMDAEGDISFVLMYCTKLFKRKTMERFIDFLKEILAIVMEDRHILLGSIAISSNLGEAQMVGEEDLEEFGF